MRTVHDLSPLEWTLSGMIPWHWGLAQSLEIGALPDAEIRAFPAKVPGSVHSNLHSAGMLPDWNQGMNARACEWVEHRHWIFQVRLPAEWFRTGARYRLRCNGLDYQGVVRCNGQEAGRFDNTHVPHLFDLTPFIKPGEENLLAVVFTGHPMWQGQFGYTSQMTDWKPRFYYTWDWTARVVQTGIWDRITIEEIAGPEITRVQVSADADPQQRLGSLRVAGNTDAPADWTVCVRLCDGEHSIRTETLSASAFRTAGLSLHGIPVKLWWPNGLGDQPLYTVTVTLVAPDGREHDTVKRRVGFRRVTWKACEGAPTEADPWICVVNDVPVFLQGVNWTPIRPNFADLTEQDYRSRIETYRELGANLFRVWGGATLERRWFYDACDELGIMVWQEFPLSSSGIDNWPPEDPLAIREMADIVRSFILRRAHHPSLIVWCGGNELQGALDGGKEGQGKPIDLKHPMIAKMAEVVAEMDPERRFLATSSTGPLFYATPDNYGKGLHWDVHGPWKAEPDLAKWREYWDGDDALFRSETGCPGCSPVEIINAHCGDESPWPVDRTNPLWRYPVDWWLEIDTYRALHDGQDPKDLNEYVTWSQTRQAEALEYAVRACKQRFPKCGGILLWMGHDCFPCTANTSILDFYGNPKPAALAVSRVWKSGK